MRFVVPIVLTAAAAGVIAITLVPRAEPAPAPTIVVAQAEEPVVPRHRVDVGPRTDDFPDVLALALLFHEWSLRTRGTSSPLPSPVLGLEQSHEVYLWARSHLAVVLTFRNSREIVHTIARIEKK